MSCELSSIVRLQIIAILKELQWDLNTFFIRTTPTEVIVTRIGDNATLTVDITKVKAKCIECYCAKWLAKLKRLILETFVSEPICPFPPLPPVIQQGSEGIQGSCDSKSTDPGGIRGSCDSKSAGPPIRVIARFPRGFVTMPALPANIIIIFVYTNIFLGAAIIATPEEIEQLQQEIPGTIINEDVLFPLAEFSSDDSTIPVKKQQVGAFIERIGANHSSQKSGDGRGSLAERTDINVFVIDTGIYPHIDLNVVGGMNFSTDDRSDWVDRIGQGTHVAGVIGALDNKIGIVGVAPGVRLWAAKVVRDDGVAFLSNALAALDWILGARNVEWFGNAVLNVSLSIPKNEVIDRVVTEMVTNGILPVVRAGDLAAPASLFSPSSSIGALTVGGTTPHPCYDTFSRSSNYGPEVAILAPSECILSTLPNNKYGIRSGTTVAAPVVTGTAALALSTSVIIGAGPEFVRQLREKIVCTSKNIAQRNFDGTRGVNKRINTRGRPVTNVSVWAGAF